MKKYFSEIMITILSIIFIIVCQCVYNGVSLSFIPLCIVLFISYFLINYLLCYRSSLQFLELRTVSHGLLLGSFEGICAYNGHVIDDGRLYIFENNLLFVDNDGLAYFDIAYENYDMIMTLNDSVLKVICNRTTYNVNDESFVFYSDNISLNVVYTTLLSRGINFGTCELKE